MGKGGSYVISKILKGMNGKDVFIMSIYNTKEWERIRERIKKLVEDEREEYIIIGGDFNIRIAEEGGNDVEGWDVKRKSKDKILNSRGWEFIDLIGSFGGYILNGATKGDEEGEFTYVGPRGCSVIDYTIVNENCIDLVSNFKIGDRVDSDHMPLLLELKDGSNRKNEVKEEGEEMENEEEGKVRICWSIRAKQLYKKKTDEIMEEVN